MRIAIVCPYDISLPGGVQNQAIELVRRLGQMGDEAWIVAPGSLDEIPVRSVGKSVSMRGNRSRVPLAFNPAAISRVRAAVSGADLCHIHEPFAPLVSLAALRSGLPSVVTFHADVPGWVRAVYRRGTAVGTWALANARALTAVSPVAAESLNRRWGTPEIIPNGLDVAAFRAKGPRHPHRVVFVGRDEQRKGLDLLLAAWSEVSDSTPDAELWVVGAERTQRLPGVTFLGRVDDTGKRAALSRSSVLVAPNLGGESFGIILAEGMAAGCAVVATNLPAFQWVLDGAGSLVPVGSAKALAVALIEVLSNSDLRTKLAEAGALRVRAFDWERVINRYRAVYSRVAG